MLKFKKKLIKKKNRKKSVYQNPKTQFNKSELDMNMLRASAHAYVTLLEDSL